MLAEAVPLYRLHIRAARLELRLPLPDELSALGAAAAAGIHEPDQRPYLARPGQTSWVLLPPAERSRAVVLKQFEAVGTWSGDDWALPLGVFADGEPIGVQVVYAKHFAITREVATSSWLTLARHGRGLGTEMRAAALAFAFEALQTKTALTHSFEDNHAACRVSEKLGYAADGVEIAAREDGQAHLAKRYRMSLDDWRARPRPKVHISGFDNARAWFFGGAS